MLVYLFGSYDSRGGTTAVVAPDRETACAGYSEACFLAELGLDDAAQGEVLDAEYLGAADLGGELPAWVEGVDLDWDDGAVFCRITGSCPAGLDHDERPEWVEGDLLELLYAADPCRDADEMPIAPSGYWHPRWDDDAYGFILITASARYPSLT